MRDNVHNCEDKDLGELLHRLFTEQPEASEIEIQHPTDGAQVVTRAEFYKTLKDLDKARKMSPADKMMKRKQLARLKTRMQIEFRTQLVTAQVVEIDVENGSFGFDATGNKMPVEGFTFVHTADYPDGTELIEDEIGSFVDESGENPPIRVKKAS